MKEYIIKEGEGELLIHMTASNENYTISYDRGQLKFQNINKTYIIPKNLGHKVIYDKLDTLTNKNKYKVEDIRTLYRDTTPTDFGISNKTNVSPNSKHTSEEIIVGGINDYIPVVAPEGVNIYVNDELVGSGTMIYNGDRVKFELVAPSSSGAIVDYNLRVGDISKNVSLETSNSNFSFDYYIAPYGNDTTGDGSYGNPFRTLKMCPVNSKIGLLPGVYSDRTGTEPKHYGYNRNGDGSVGCINLMSNMGSNPKGLPQKNYKLHSKFLTINGFSGRTGNYTLIGAVEPGTVIIEMGLAPNVRDYPFSTSYYNNMSNMVFSDIIINASRGKTTNYSSSWSVWTEFTIFLNCQFNETGYYSLQYHNYSSNPIAYVNCEFTGTRLSTYSGVARELTMSITREEYLNGN